MRASWWRITLTIGFVFGLSRRSVLLKEENAQLRRRPLVFSSTSV